MDFQHFNNRYRAWEYQEYSVNFFNNQGVLIVRKYRSIINMLTWDELCGLMQGVERIVVLTICKFKSDSKILAQLKVLNGGKIWLEHFKQEHLLRFYDNA